MTPLRRAASRALLRIPFSLAPLREQLRDSNSAQRHHKSSAQIPAFCTTTNVLHKHQHAVQLPAWCATISVLRQHQLVSPQKACFSNTSVFRHHKRVAPLACCTTTSVFSHYKLVASPSMRYLLPVRCVPSIESRLPDCNNSTRHLCFHCALWRYLHSVPPIARVVVIITLHLHIRFVLLHYGDLFCVHVVTRITALVDAKACLSQ